MRRSTLLGMLAVMVALALAAPGGASASHRQAMILQDDAKLIYSSPQSVSATLQTLKNMGVDRVRVSVVWQLLAPQPSAAKKPKFDATNPDAYPNGVWSRYDFLDRVATQDGLQVYFQPTAPAPNWATTPRKLPQGYRYAHDPNAADYGQFVQAVAKRYDGDFVAPGGVALLIEALTDNRNRTGADVRHALSKHGGNLGEPGSVSYLFDKRGVIVVDGSRYDEDDLMVAIDAGAEDILADDDVFEIVTEPSDLTAVRAALSDAGIELESADVVQRPKVRVPVQESDAARLLKLIDMLEEYDDVNEVHANFDVDADVLERIAG